MNTVNYNDARQLFGAVGTSLKKHTAEIADIVNVYGAKNLCPVQVGSQIFRGITYTVNSDNSITASGTVESGYSTANINISEFSVKNLIGKKIIMSGGNSLSNSLYLVFDCMASDGTRIKRNEVKTSEPLEYTIPNNASYFRVNIALQSTFSGTATTIYPMIRLASIEDNTYVPYAKSNKELTDDISSLAARIKAIEDTNHLTWG